jgi:transposase
MSTSILYHAFGVKGIYYESAPYLGDSLLFRARTTDRYVKCPQCGARRATFKGQKRRLFRMSPMGRKRCFLDLLLHRLKCQECGSLWWHRLPFMDGNHRYVRSFALTVLDLLQFCTIQAASEYLGVGWDMIKEIHKERLSLLYRTIPLGEVRHIGIDEFSLRKGHEYMTIVTDLESGRILHAVEGKGKEDIRPFLQRLSRKAKNLEAVAMDMSSAYFSSVCQCLPRVDVVFDRFHIIALMNQALDEIRRQQQRELDDLGQKTLKGSRFLLLRNYNSLEPGRKARLDALLFQRVRIISAPTQYEEQPNGDGGAEDKSPGLTISISS